MEYISHSWIIDRTHLYFGSSFLHKLLVNADEKDTSSQTSIYIRGLSTVGAVLLILMDLNNPISLNIEEQVQGSNVGLSSRDARLNER
jgi:hypothetical protein